VWRSWWAAREDPRSSDSHLLVGDERLTSFDDLDTVTDADHASALVVEVHPEAHVVAEAAMSSERLEGLLTHPFPGLLVGRSDDAASASLHPVERDVADAEDTPRLLLEPVGATAHHDIGPEAVHADPGVADLGVQRRQRLFGGEQERVGVREAVEHLAAFVLLFSSESPRRVGDVDEAHRALERTREDVVGLIPLNDRLDGVVPHGGHDAFTLVPAEHARHLDQGRPHLSVDLEVGASFLDDLDAVGRELWALALGDEPAIRIDQHETPVVFEAAFSHADLVVALTLHGLHRVREKTDNLEQGHWDLRVGCETLLK
jgi:hypothetical protein